MFRLIPVSLEEAVVVLENVGTHIVVPIQLFDQMKQNQKKPRKKRVTKKEVTNV